MNQIVIGAIGIVIGFGLTANMVFIERSRIVELIKEINKLKRYNRELEDELNKYKK